MRTFFILLTLLLAACAAPVKQTGNERPAWIDNPGNGVSASSGIHIRGRVAQEELAIARAREEFAKRFGVSISSAQLLATTVANGRSNTVGAQVSREESRQVDIKAMVKAKWTDPANETLWVWLVPSDQ